MKHWALLFLWFVPITIAKAQNVREDDKKIAVDSFKIHNVKYLEMNETISPHADIFNWKCQRRKCQQNFNLWQSQIRKPTLCHTLRWKIQQ